MISDKNEKTSLSLPNEVHNQTISDLEDIENLETIKDCCAPPRTWPTELALRSMIYRASELGIEEAFVRVGRRVLVNRRKLFSLLKINSEKRQQGGNCESLHVKEPGRPRL